MKIRTIALVIITFVFLSKTNAQNKLTPDDIKEITFQVKQTMRDLADLMNYVTDAQVKKGLILSSIDSSVTPSSKYRIFYDRKVIIENDLDPASGLGKTNDVAVDKYLTDLNIYTAGETYLKVNYISNVRLKDYLFVRVRFDSKLNKYKRTNTVYSLKQREVLLRIEGADDKKWKALIIGIRFYDPASHIEISDKSLAAPIDSTVNVRPGDVPVQESIVQQELKDSLRLVKLEKEKDIVVNNYLTKADSLKNKAKYTDGLSMLKKAKDIKPRWPPIDILIMDMERLVEEHTYEYAKNQGDKAAAEHRYIDAIQAYKRAMDHPEGQSLGATVDLLLKRNKDISLPANRLQGNDFTGAISECETVLKAHKTEKNAYPELYFIQGTAYQQLKEYKKALENYNQAIIYFPNYTAALIARARLHIAFKADYYQAITDYDVLTSNARDDDAEKPGYYVVKAKWKTILGINKGAIGDYTSAITLSKDDSLYYLRAKLLYAMNQFDDALNDLDVALQLNAKNKNAYYYRGLSYVSVKKYDKAGSDFSEAEKLGFLPAQLAVVDSISNSYFITGQTALSSREFINADSSFNIALKIRRCNAKALHGKAEIRFIIGSEAKWAFKPYKASLSESIALNKQAINCAPNFSDAFFKEGLAQSYIAGYENAAKSLTYKKSLTQSEMAEYDIVINSFSEAIRSDNENIPAYVERGNIYQIQQKFNKAVDDYAQAAGLLLTENEKAKKSGNKTQTQRITKDISQAFQLCAQAQYNLNNNEGAVTAANSAINYNENNADAYYYRGLANFDKEISRAINDFNTALKISAQPQYCYANGKAYFIKKNYQVAMGNFSDLIKLDSANVFKNKKYLRGLCYFKLKTLPEALQDFADYDTSAIAKNDTSFHFNYGLAQLYANQDSAAVKNLAITLKLSPEHPKALFAQGCASAKNGQFADALVLLERSFATHQISSDDIKPEEEAFLAGLKKDKANRAKYNKLKKDYLSN